MNRLHVVTTPVGELVLVEFGHQGPHWVLSRPDTLAVGWALVDAAVGHPPPAGVLVTDLHRSAPAPGVGEQHRDAEQQQPDQQ